jgi:hypothetical protein
MIPKFSKQPDFSHSQILIKAGQKKVEPNRPLVSGQAPRRRSTFFPVRPSVLHLLLRPSCETARAEPEREYHSSSAFPVLPARTAARDDAHVPVPERPVVALRVTSGRATPRRDETAPPPARARPHSRSWALGRSQVQCRRGGVGDWTLGQGRALLGRCRKWGQRPARTGSAARRPGRWTWTAVLRSRSGEGLLARAELS